LVLTYVEKDDLRKVRDVLESFRIAKPLIEVGMDDKPDEVKERLWNILGLIKVYCKEPGKKPEKKPMVLKKGSTVEDAARDLHKDFSVYFNFARVWGSTKYAGEKVGPDYELEDEDILEVHIT
jgi:ribosome-interacting GTPase 1